jgi:hypothetical protein
MPQFDRAAFWKTFRWFSSIGGTLIIVWSMSGPFVKPLVAQELLTILKNNGIDRETIKDMGEQGIKNGQDIGELAEDANKIKADVNAVKIQNQLIINKVDNAAALLEKLLDRELRRTGENQQ